MRLDVLGALNAARAERRAAAIVTMLDAGEQRLVLDPAGDDLEGELRAAFVAGRGRVVRAPGGAEAFIDVQLPPMRLVLVGAVHIAQALAPIAVALGYDVTVVDPRTAFATADRFPGVALKAEWPDVALQGIGLDRFTAVAALSHDPKIDDPALVAALGAGCFYVGALGSRKTHAARRERLLAAGLDGAAIDGVRSPIGLPIGAASPAEIAVSIIAEITAVARRPGETVRTERAP